MAIEVKICGINSPAAADAVLHARADFAGLNFHPASPRRVSYEQGATLADRLRGQARVVAVMGDANDEEIAGIVRSVQPAILQLHGRETPERVAAIRAKFAIPVMKAMPIADASDLAQLAAYEGVADRILFDTKAPPHAAHEGGQGAAFDWRLLRGRRFVRPWMLAGGLKPDNVARAIAVSGAAAVDVSSGVETAPGVKSAELVRAFVEAARAAQYAKEERA